MPKMEKHYTNGDITVVWKPELCQHSTLCWRNLIQVFNPNKHPWVDMQGADTDTIIVQVEHCPSRALTWFKNTGEVEAEK